MNLQNPEWLKSFDLPDTLLPYAVQNVLTDLLTGLDTRDNLRRFFLAWMLCQVKQHPADTFTVELDQKEISRGWGETTNLVRQMLPYLNLGIVTAKPGRIQLVPTNVNHGLQNGVTTYNLVFVAPKHTLPQPAFQESLVGQCIKGLLSDDPLELAYGGVMCPTGVLVYDIEGQIIATLPVEQYRDFESQYNRVLCPVPG